MNETSASPCLGHVAIFTPDPYRLAAFYEETFNMQIVRRRHAVWLWDGRIHLALNPWRAGGDEVERRDEVGEIYARKLDHFGFQVGSVDSFKDPIKRAGATMEPQLRPSGRSFAEWRFHDPEENRVDLSEMGFKQEIASDAAPASVIGRIVLFTTDPSRLADFYASVFALRTVYKSANSTALTDGNAQLVLVNPEPNSVCGLYCFGFRVADERKTTGRLERLGISVSSRPDWIDGNKNQFHARDLDGNPVTFLS